MEQRLRVQRGRPGRRPDRRAAHDQIVAVIVKRHRADALNAEGEAAEQVGDMWLAGRRLRVV